MSNREVMQQALEALENCRIEYDYHGNPIDEENAALIKAADALRAALAEQSDPKLRYDGLYEYAAQHRLNYNDLCRVVRAALTEPVQEPVEWLPLTDAQLRAMFEIGEQE